MNRSPGVPSRWQIWNLNQTKSRLNADPRQPTDDSKNFRPYLIISDINNYQKVICLPVQDLGSGAGLVEVKLSLSEYPFLRKDSKVLCFEVYTLKISFFNDLIGSIKDDDRKNVSEKVKRVLRLS